MKTPFLYMYTMGIVRTMSIISVVRFTVEFSMGTHMHL